MPPKPNVLTAFRPSGNINEVIEPGDVALLLKKDGSVQALTFGYDSSRLALPESEHNDDDRAMLRQGDRLFALALAAQTPRLMNLLLDIAADPEVVDFEKLASFTRVH